MTRKILPKMVGCVVVLVMLYLTLPAGAAVVAVSGASDTEDTWVTDLINGEVNYNYGGSDFIEIGDKDGDGDTYDDDKRYGLLKWDLSSITALAGAGQRINVSNATVSLSYTGTGDPDIVVNLWFVAAGNADHFAGLVDGECPADAAAERAEILDGELVRGGGPRHGDRQQSNHNKAQTDGRSHVLCPSVLLAP